MLAQGRAGKLLPPAGAAGGPSGRGQPVLGPLLSHLPCGLRDAGCSNSVIREALRWATDEALLLYARANVAYDTELRSSAANATVSSIRVPTVLSGPSAPGVGTGGGPAMGGDVRPSSGLADVEDPSEEVVSNAVGVSGTAAGLRDDVAAGSNLPDVDSDLRAFSGISLSMSALRAAAARPLEGSTAEGEDGGGVSDDDA